MELSKTRVPAEGSRAHRSAHKEALSRDRSRAQGDMKIITCYYVQKGIYLNTKEIVSDTYTERGMKGKREGEIQPLVPILQRKN